MAMDQQGATGASQDNTTDEQAAAAAAAADQAAQQQEQKDSAQDTTVSGDAKGDTQTITSNDVGSVADVLGAGADSTATKETPTPMAEETAAAAAAAALQQQQDAAAAAAVQAAAKPAAVTAQVRKSIPAPVAQQTGARDESVAAPVAAAVTQTAPTGVSVTNTAASVSDDDRQLPEVVAAMKVGKPQTQSALYQVIDYAKNMHPTKRQDAKSIEAAQISLRVNLFTILSAEDVNFKVVYQALLAVVRKHKNNCFAITARNRGLNSVSLQALDNKNMRFLTKIVDLLVLTAGSTSIEDVKRHYDFSKLAEWCMNQRIQQNLTSYYA